MCFFHFVQNFIGYGPRLLKILKHVFDYLTFYYCKQFAKFQFNTFFWKILFNYRKEIFLQCILLLKVKRVSSIRISTLPNFKLELNILFCCMFYKNEKKSVWNSNNFSNFNLNPTYRIFKWYNNNIYWNITRRSIFFKRFRLIK